MTIEIPKPLPRLHLMPYELGYHTLSFEQGRLARPTVSQHNAISAPVRIVEHTGNREYMTARSLLQFVVNY